MKLLIISKAQQPVPRKFLDSWSRLLSAELVREKIVSKEIKNIEMTLVFLEPTAAKKINNEFRQKNYATDVLSFESMMADSLGELVLCPAVLKRQAAEHGLTYRDELAYMVLHGTLHLLGYDHETSERDAKEMFELQDRLFEKLLRKIKG